MTWVTSFSSCSYICHITWLYLAPLPTGNHRVELAASCLTAGWTGNNTWQATTPFPALMMTLKILPMSTSVRWALYYKCIITQVSPSSRAGKVIIWLQSSSELLLNHNYSQNVSRLLLLKQRSLSAFAPTLANVFSWLPSLLVNESTKWARA